MTKQISEPVTKAGLYRFDKDLYKKYPSAILRVWTKSGKMCTKLIDFEAPEDDVQFKAAVNLWEHATGDSSLPRDNIVAINKWMHDALFRPVEVLYAPYNNGNKVYNTIYGLKWSDKACHVERTEHKPLRTEWDNSSLFEEKPTHQTKKCPHCKETIIVKVIDKDNVAFGKNRNK